MAKLIKEMQDLTYLDWSHVRNSSGTAGTFLKSESLIDGRKKYYKLSNYDATRGVIGYECVNELIVDRLLEILGVDHLEYELVNALIEIDEREYNTYLCGSYDFKQRGESKMSLENLYEINKEKGESPYEFCVRYGWKDEIDRMIAIDYIILNRDRHGANIEVLQNKWNKTIRLAPLFDHGLSLLFSCEDEADLKSFDIMCDTPCNNFIGGRSTYENLALIDDRRGVFPNVLKENHKDVLFCGLEDVIPIAYQDAIWNMIYKRYTAYEDF